MSALKCTAKDADECKPNICDEVMLLRHLISDKNISEVGYASINR
jgi:hypothetical protein